MSRDLYIDYKVTVWSRIYFNSKEDLEECIEKMKTGEMPYTFNEDDGVDEYEDILETTEFIPPIENDGQSTIECYHGKTLLWDNSFETELKNKQTK